MKQKSRTYIVRKKQFDEFVWENVAMTTSYRLAWECVEAFKLQEMEKVIYDVQPIKLKKKVTN